MNSELYFVGFVAALIFLWYLSFTASRLDRLHHRVETSWASLDALLQQRAALALEVSHLPRIDPAIAMVCNGLFCSRFEATRHFQNVASLA